MLRLPKFLLRLPKFLKRKKTDVPASEPDSDHDRFFIKYMSLTVLMLFWPWLLFGILRRRDGVPFHGRSARYLQNNPKDTTFFFTTIGNLIKSADCFIFAKAVTSLAKKWVSTHDTSLFLLSFFDALKNTRVTWPSGRWSQFLVGNRWQFYVVVTFFFITLQFDNSGITSLITPAAFPRKGSLEVTELDFTSTNESCINWFNSNTLTPNCDWLDPVNGTRFTRCLVENQLVDVLESGRGNMLSRLEANTSFALSQVGVAFTGSTRGVLPDGPRGVVNTSMPSPFADAAAANTAFNYTLDLQGVSSQVSCMYKPNSIVNITVLSSDFWQYTGTCPTGQQEILLGLDSQNVAQKAIFSAPSSDNFLGFWACKTNPPGSSDSYEVHFRGQGRYFTDAVANVTCTVSQFRPAVFPVTYHSLPGLFTVGQPKPTLLSSSTELANLSVKELGAVVSESQSPTTNIFAESITTFKAKYLNLDPYQHDAQFLQLLESMTQGVLEYQAMYIRLLYHLQATIGSPLPPPNCFRPVIGQGSYALFGWFATRRTGYFLLPMTILNVSSLVLFLLAMHKGDKDLPPFDSTDPEACIYASHQFNHLRDQTSHTMKDKRVWNELVKCEGMYEYGPPQSSGPRRPPSARLSSDVKEKMSIEERT